MSVIAVKPPRTIPEERQCDVHIAAERTPDRRPVLLGPDQCFPRVEVLGFVKVAVGHVRIVFEARDGEQVVPIGSLPHIDEISQFLAVVPQVAGAISKRRGAR